MKKLSIFAMTLVLGFGTARFGQAQIEGLTKDKVPPPANKLYEDNLRLPDDAGKLFLPDDAYLVGRCPQARRLMPASMAWR